MNNPIKIDETAQSKLNELCNQNQEYRFFRIYITGGGCSGFQYGFQFDHHSQDDDFVINEDSCFANIVIDPISFQYLSGSTLFYEIGLMGQHFTVANPNAKSTCGCGISFDI